MKELKKSPRLQLEKFSTIFTQLGLVLVLFIVFISLEYETEYSEVVYKQPKEDPTDVFTYDKPIVFVKQKVQRVQQRAEPLITTVIDNPEVVPDTTPDETIVDVPVDDTPVVDVATFDEEVEDDIIDEADDPTPVSMKFVSKVPVFKGCENLSEQESRKCFDKKINRLINRYFDTDLANELGLKKGKNKILTQFVIDKNGNVTDVQIRAPHVRLKKETQRIINKIPVFTPGENNGKPVNVRYTLPINFQVEY